MLLISSVNFPSVVQSLPIPSKSSGSRAHVWLFLSQWQAWGHVQSFWEGTLPTFVLGFPANVYPLFVTVKLEQGKRSSG